MSLSIEHATWHQRVPWVHQTDAAIYDLAHDLQTGMSHHPIHPPYAYTLTKKHGDVMYPDEISSAGGLFMMGDHVGTHIDALNHVSKTGKIYPNTPVEDDQDYGQGIQAGSIHTAAPLLTKGYLVDLTAVLGRTMEPGEPIEAVHLDSWFESRADVQRGSAVFFRTGWDEFWSEPERFIGVNSGLPGVSLDAAKWLTDRGVAYTGADTVAYEVMPSPSLAVHCHLLVDHGVHILESLNLKELSRDGHRMFDLVAVPLPIKGGTASPVRPLAIVASQ